MMTAAQIVFDELQRQGLPGATLALQSGKVFLQGEAEIDCNALAMAFRERPLALTHKARDVARDEGIPPSLAIVPNIPWDKQTIDQLEQERDYWNGKARDASGPASAAAADEFSKACQAWIDKRRRELRNSMNRLENGE